MTNNNEQRLNTIIYIISLAQSVHRFTKGQSPFDFENTATAEYLMAKCMPFIKNENEDYEIAHRSFLMDMFGNGWTCGSEDFANRVHPDLVEYNELPQESKEMIAFTAALVCSAQEFYKNIKTELEEEFIDSFNSSVKKMSFSNTIRDTLATH